MGVESNVMSSSWLTNMNAGENIILFMQAALDGANAVKGLLGGVHAGNTGPTLTTNTKAAERMIRGMHHPCDATLVMRTGG